MDHSRSPEKRLAELREAPANSVCADCASSDSTWVSMSKKFNVFICIRCSGVHRSLGTHICRVRSVELDNWTHELVDQVASGGNAHGNALLEAHICSPFVKLTPQSTSNDAEDYIQAKYAKELFKAVEVKSPRPEPINVAGTKCKAKYYGDGKFYDATISAEKDGEYVVRFIDYHNEEQVTRKKDVMLLSAPPPRPSRPIPGHRPQPPRKPHLRRSISQESFLLKSPDFNSPTPFNPRGPLRPEPPIYQTQPVRPERPMLTRTSGQAFRDRARTAAPQVPTSPRTLPDAPSGEAHPVSPREPKPIRPPPPKQQDKPVPKLIPYPPMQQASPHFPEPINTYNPPSHAVEKEEIASFHKRLAGLEDELGSRRSLNKYTSEDSIPNGSIRGRAQTHTPDLSSAEGYVYNKPEKKPKKKKERKEGDKEKKRDRKEKKHEKRKKRRKDLKKTISLVDLRKLWTQHGSSDEMSGEPTPRDVLNRSDKKPKTKKEKKHKKAKKEAEKKAGLVTPRGGNPPSSGVHEEKIAA